MDLIEQNMRRFGMSRAESEDAVRGVLVADRYADQIENTKAWSRLAPELLDMFGADVDDALQRLIAILPRILNNATLKAGREELADLLDAPRQREAEKYVRANWRKLIEVEREP